MTDQIPAGKPVGPQNATQRPAPVDSGAIGRLNEAEMAALVNAGMEMPSAFPVGTIILATIERILREHTDRALAEVEQRIEAEMWTGGAGPLSIVRAARQEQGR